MTGPHIEIPLTPVQSLYGVTLAESALHRYLAFGALYFAQGLPIGLLLVAIPAWLAKQGLGTAEVGRFVAVVTLPWTLKLVWGPVLDRFGYLPMGRRRPWIILAQASLLGSLLLLSLVPDPAVNLQLLSSVGFMVSVFASLQDVAVDGLAIDVLPVEQRGRASGIMFGGQSLGIASASAGGATLLNLYGLQGVAVVGAGLVGLILLFPFLFRERPGERLLPWTSGEASAAATQLQLKEWRPIIGGVLRAVVLPASLAAAAIFFTVRMGEDIFLALRPVLFVQTLGWSDTEYSQLVATARVVAAVCEVVIGTTVVDRLGPLRTVIIATLLGAALNATVGFSSHLWSVPGLMAGAVLIGAGLAEAARVAAAAVFMSLCWRRVAATQFALYMAVAGNLGLPVGGSVTGVLNQFLDYPQIFLAIAGAEVMVLVLLRFVNLTGHHARLDGFDKEARQ